MCTWYTNTTTEVHVCYIEPSVWQPPSHLEDSVVVHRFLSNVNGVGTHRRSSIVDDELLQHMLTVLLPLLSDSVDDNWLLGVQGLHALVLLHCQTCLTRHVAASLNFEP